MSETPKRVKPVGGVDRSKGRANAQKVLFYGIHTLSLLICGWIVLGGGLSTVGGGFGLQWTVADPQRATLVLAATALYWARHGYTLFFLIVRRVAWGEAAGLASFLILIEVGMCALSTGFLRGLPTPLGIIDWLAVGLVLIGSYFNSGSEIQRKRWKEDPANKGHCYTEGLFSLSMHINYFGDTLLFTGWALLTSYWLTLLVAAVMTAGFIFFHIPGLDAYLAERYQDEFSAYARKTKTFIPFIY